ncbi:MAG: phosphohistidine phosphatase SixA [Verrucomicrobiota bacterium]|jgi:phosphohistidine phosphatase|nr:phosphohistidine phosphatase SixA [Chthoniobacterales bacterium]MDQ3118094.1 phosphohistidine phosphatase SixA [Verrucomicrobiota bacterium]MDQ3545032.1 phosphohistidine phosphatase SixA [Verrucomicrobiota bacterium]
MRIYLLRHGAADWPDWTGPDDDRPLTDAGRQEVAEVGRFLFRQQAAPDVILTSPLPRAAQTAEIAAAHLRAPIHEEKLLAPGFGGDDLKRLRQKYPQDSLMLVGHEPDFTEVIAALTGASLKLSKAGLALVDLKSQKGKLLWLLPPKLAKA